MQTPRTRDHPTDAIAGKPAPTKSGQPVAGLPAIAPEDMKLLVDNLF
jgi:hypothetical protein